MTSRSRLFVGALIVVLGFGSFFAGRTVEKNAQAARIHSMDIVAASPSPMTQPELTSYRQIAVEEILALPFAEFYEALRSAPAEARKKWATELEKMPEGPRWRAAFSGFYKLLVQFDPAAAAKAITEIKDKQAQRLALQVVIDAAPGFALPLMADLTTNPLIVENGGTTQFLTVLAEWSQIDPAAAASFLDAHPPRQDETAYRDLISNWAALDPDAAKSCMDRKELWEGFELRRSFFQGWYENDRTAVVTYVLGHAKDPAMKDPIGDVLRGLYFDSKEEARKFIEKLPDDASRHDAFHEAFTNLLLSDERETGEPRTSPRAVGDFLTEFPPAYWKDALTNVFKWNKRPSQEILAWVEQQPLTIREAVAAEYAAPFQVKPPEAIVPVLQMADPVLRDQLLKAMFKHFDGAPEEIRAAVRNASITTEQKSHVLQIVDQVEADSKTTPAE